MRKLLYLLRPMMAACFCWLSAAPTRAQAPAWQMALAIGTSAGSASGVTATAVDASGNVYLAGFFENSVTFGATTLTSAGHFDAFVAKWIPATGFVWAQQAAGADTDEAIALAVNGSSVYVAGYFRSPTLTFGTTRLVNAGRDDAFVAKLTDLGRTSTWTWVQQVGGTKDDDIFALAVSASNVYVTGRSYSPTLTFGATTLTNAGGDELDLFVAKLTDAGSTWTWAQKVRGTSDDYVNALAVSGSSVYVAGVFDSPTLSFGATTLTNTYKFDSGRRNGFVAKLADAGNTSAWAWAQQVGKTDLDAVEALVVSGTSVYVAGGFHSPRLTIGATKLKATGEKSIFVAKLTDAGNTSTWTWAQSAGGMGGTSAETLAVSGGSVYVAGFFSHTLTVGATTLQNAGKRDLFVAKLLDVGSTSTWTWAQSAGGMGYNCAKALAVSGGSVYVAGYFGGAVTFGSSRLTSTRSTGFLAAFTD